MIPNVLTIAGSDSGGGAGIQADLKAFSALGAYGLSVVTALTAQNTRGVSAVYPVPSDFVAAELDAVFSDVRIDAVKLGMLANEQIINTVSSYLRQSSATDVVLDTVMIAKGGHQLLEPGAIQALREKLLPLATLITPNLPEAAVLLGCAPAETEDAMCKQDRALLALGAQAVLMKGGHLGGTESPDWLITATEEMRISRLRVATRHSHGTGCTLSAALAALRPQMNSWVATITAARDYLQAALAAAKRLNVGQGIGPVHHFHAWW